MRAPARRACAQIQIRDNGAPSIASPRSHAVSLTRAAAARRGKSGRAAFAN